jgi:hypothetical protein
MTSGQVVWSIMSSRIRMRTLKQVCLDAWEVGLQPFKINLVDSCGGGNWQKFHGSQFSWITFLFYGVVAILSQ